MERYSWSGGSDDKNFFGFEAAIQAWAEDKTRLN